MEKKTVYGICLAPEEASNLAVATRSLGPDYTLVTSLTKPIKTSAAEEALENGGWERIKDAGPFCAPLVRSNADSWPKGKANAEIIMEQEPSSLDNWVLRNLLWQLCCKGFIWWVSEDTVKQQDITVHLTVAKMFNHLSIGILPSGMRTMLESTQLTLTDCCVGQADSRSLLGLLGTL